MTDPITASARFVLKEALVELRAAVEGVPAEALNWRPAGEETNSIAVLATHALHSTRLWLSVAVGTPLPERDRGSEFRATEDDPEALLQLIDEKSGECLELLRGAGNVEWSVLRKTDIHPDHELHEVTAGFALLQALQHLGQHIAHCSLTRQLWENRVEAA